MNRTNNLFTKELLSSGVGQQSQSHASKAFTSAGSVLTPRLPYRPGHVVPTQTEINLLLGTNVTICLVARCWQDNCLVAVSDRRLSYGDVFEATDDAMLKTFQLCPGWGVMFAANDISSVAGMIEYARTSLRTSKWPDKSPQPSLDDVKKAVRGAYLAAIREKVIGHYLARLGFETMEAFLESGLNKLGHEEFGKRVTKIEEFDLGVSLLVYGFDENPAKGPHIFEVQNAEIFDHGMEGFGVIGSGGQQALGVLSVRGVNGLATVNEAVYRLCEAKFCAETASGVGRATTVMVLGANGKMRQLPPGEIDKLRNIWNETRKAAIPEGVGALLGSRFDKLKNADEDEA